MTTTLLQHDPLITPVNQNKGLDLRLGWEAWLILRIDHPAGPLKQDIFTVYIRKGLSEQNTQQHYKPPWFEFSQITSVRWLCLFVCFYKNMKMELMHQSYLSAKIITKDNVSQFPNVIGSAPKHTPASTALSLAMCAWYRPSNRSLLLAYEAVIRMRDWSCLGSQKHPLPRMAGNPGLMWKWGQTV